MKRDARLCRLGERRQPHGGRWRTPRYRPRSRYGVLVAALATMADAAGVSARSLKRMSQAAAEAAEAEREFVAYLRQRAQVVADEMTRQLRDDFALYGEAYVKVSWDDRPLVERIDPAFIS